MQNSTSVKIPKKYVDKLNEIYYMEDSYWAISSKGYCFLDSDPYGGCHTAHEDTQQGLSKVIKSIAACNCDRCLPQ